MLNSTWLEELASESNTIQAQEDITSPGKTAGTDPRKLYMTFDRFFIDISGSMYSFGLASCVDLEFISLLQWIAAGSWCEALSSRSKCQVALREVPGGSSSLHSGDPFNP